jgi:hypothetical protein
MERWCVLTKQTFRYFKSEWAANLWGNKPLAVIPIERIRNAEIDPAARTNFEVYLMMATSTRGTESSINPFNRLGGSLATQLLMKACANKVQSLVDRNHLMTKPIKALERSHASVKNRSSWTNREVAWYENEDRLYFKAASKEEAKKWVETIKRVKSI